MKRLLTGIIALFVSTTLLVGCGNTQSEQTATSAEQTTTSAEQTTTTSQAAEQAPRSKMATELKAMLDADPELKALLEKSIAKAAQINPDTATNPVQNLDELYDYCDWATTCLPWNVIESAQSGLYERIDQSVDYFWFLVDQPLEELEDKGYYYPTLQYHEPIASWCKTYADEWGAFLSTPESWNDEYYELVKADERFGMDKGWYGDANIWTSFNDWFARKLVDAETSRPIADTAVVAPADSKPQGIWRINADNTLQQQEGVVVKSKRVVSASELLGPQSAYQSSFAGGTFTHTFLDVNDYHRYHFPVSGTIVEVQKIPATNAAGGITVWDEASGRYLLEDTVPGWQMVETRDLVVVDTHDHGLVAILPIGMSQICSCNWEDTVKVGAEVQKGDPMGYFLFGGSDICMLFQEGVNVELVVPQTAEGDYEHLLMGEAYAQLS